MEFTKPQLTPSALAMAEMLIRSIAKHCKIHRVTRLVTLQRLLAQSSGAWKISRVQVVLVQVNRGNRTLSSVG